MTTAPTGTRTIQNYVGGSFTAPSTDRTLEVLNPATQEPLALVPLSSADDLEQAVAAARAALPGWRSKPVIERARWLFSLRERLNEHIDELARLVTTEMGKTIGDARAEVARMIEMVECACAIPTTMQGRNLENVATNVDAETIRQPVGVCAAIVPFNFPAMVPFWFLPFAIACGNTFVLKPSEQVPLTQNRVFELIDELGPAARRGQPRQRRPRGGRGDPRLAGHRRRLVRRLAPVARHIYARAAAAGKRVQALGGAKNHIVVMPDAVIDKTVDGILLGLRRGRTALHGGLGRGHRGRGHERRSSRARQRRARLRVGDGLDEDTARRTRHLLRLARADRGLDREAAAEAPSSSSTGAATRPGSGSFVGPTIINDVRPRHGRSPARRSSARALDHPDRTLEEAIAMVNARRYGNGTSIFTESGGAVRRYRHDVEVGMIGVNIGVAAPVAFFPFSGWKDSFLGDLHAHGPDAIEFFTRKKTVTSRWFSDSGGGARLFGEH